MKIIGTTQIYTSYTGTLLTITHHTFCFFAFFGDHTDIDDPGFLTNFGVARGMSGTEYMGPTTVTGEFKSTSSSEIMSDE